MHNSWINCLNCLKLDKWLRVPVDGNDFLGWISPWGALTWVELPCNDVTRRDDTAGKGAGTEGTLPKKVSVALSQERRTSLLSQKLC